MTTIPTKITFFEFLTPLVASGEKTITIRDHTENNYVPGTQVEVFTLETDLKVCDIRILAVEPIKFSDLNEFHAKQESLSLERLQQIIRQVYPKTEDLFVISFELLK